MKKVKLLLLIVGITFLSVGVGGYVLARENDVIQERSYSIRTQVGDKMIGYTNESYSPAAMTHEIEKGY